MDLFDELGLSFDESRKECYYSALMCWGSGPRSCVTMQTTMRQLLDESKLDLDHEGLGG